MGLIESDMTATEHRLIFVGRVNPRGSILPKHCTIRLLPIPPNNTSLHSPIYQRNSPSSQTTHHLDCNLFPQGTIPALRSLIQTGYIICLLSSVQTQSEGVNQSFRLPLYRYHGCYSPKKTAPFQNLNFLFYQFSGLSTPPRHPDLIHCLAQ